MMKESYNFGEFVFEKRSKMKLSLREFCRRFGYEPSYISRLENSIINAPSDQKKLSALALALEIEEESEDWVTFFSLAASSRIIVPKDIKDDFPGMVKFLPAFFRTVRKGDMREKDIKNLIKLIHEQQDND